MRYLYGIFALFIWCIFLGYSITNGVEISNDVQIITTAIGVAGAMAGGD